jgi:hypothetical protein
MMPAKLALVDPEHDKTIMEQSYKLIWHDGTVERAASDRTDIAPRHLIGLRSWPPQLAASFVRWVARCIGRV